MRRGAEEGNGYVNWSRYTFDFLPPPLAGRGRPRDGDSLSILYERRLLSLVAFALFYPPSFSLPCFP